MAINLHTKNFSMAQNPNPDIGSPPTVRQVSKFIDMWGIVEPYCGWFDFEVDPHFDYRKNFDYEDEDDSNHVENPRETLIRYVNQIRKSFGFNVDCVAPSWFNGPFHPIDLLKAELNKHVEHGDYDCIVKVTDFALAHINAETGKKYELVEVKKAVEAHLGILFLTFGVKDADDDDDRTIQVIGWERIGDKKIVLYQWRYKPVEEDVWFEMPPLPDSYLQPPPPPQDH